MALYSFANGQIIPALRLLYRARYLAVLIYGDDHPDMALLDVSTVGIILVEMQYEFKNIGVFKSSQFFETNFNAIA